MFVQFILLALLTVASAYPQTMSGIEMRQLDTMERDMMDDPTPEIENREEEVTREPNYSFEYEVKDDKTGDYKTHRESRQGDYVEGYYSLVEPDGTLREVRYTVTKEDGFKAVVTRSGTPYVALNTPLNDVESRSQTPEESDVMSEDETQPAPVQKFNSRSDTVKMENQISSSSNQQYKKAPYPLVRNVRAKKPRNVHKSTRDRRYH